MLILLPLNMALLLKNSYFVGFEVFTAVVLKSIVFWDMTPCSALSGTRRFGGTITLANSVVYIITTLVDIH
jgi:hypothetical protein